MTPERKEYEREYRAKNKERLKAKNAAWRAKNKDYLSEAAKKYVAENADAVKARRAARYAANAEVIRAKRKAARQANPAHEAELKRLSYERHKAKRLAARAEYRAANPDKIAAYKTANKDKIDAYSAAFREANREKLRQVSLEWHNSHPEVRLASNSRYRARKLKALPQWDFELTDFVTKEAAELTRIRKTHTGVSWHVDHVIPLRGKLVSGLHVWNNLRVVPATVNKHKANSFSPQPMAA